MKPGMLFEENPARHNNYRLRVQPVRLGPNRNFQVRIGMDGDNGLDYIPLHRSAFARLLQVEIAHAEKREAELEAQMIAEFLRCELAGYSPNLSPKTSPLNAGAPGRLLRRPGIASRFGVKSQVTQENRYEPSGFCQRSQASL